MRKSLDVKMEFRCDVLNLVFVEVAVVFHELFMKLPEFSLLLGRKGCCCGLSGKSVASERKLFDHEFGFLGIFFQHLLDERIKPRAIGSLIITENHDRDRGIRRSLERQAGKVKSMDLFQLEELHGL